jgi:hypothetical protein
VITLLPTVQTIGKDVQLSVKINHVEVIEGYSVFMRMIFNSKNTMFAEKVEFGVCKNSELRQLLDAPMKSVGEILSENKYYLVKKMFAEDYLQDFHTAKNNFRLYLPEYTAGFLFLLSKTTEDYLVVRFDSNKEEFIDVSTDKYLPRTYYFDYINGRVHDGTYDLNKCLEVLESRDDVTIKEDAWNEKISGIPDYIGSGFYINFTFRPTQDIMEKIKSRGNLSSSEVCEFIVEEVLKLPKYKEAV